MNIKQKKQLNLPQLIEWAWSNPELTKNKSIFDDNQSSVAEFDEDGRFETNFYISSTDTFTIEVEEEITEDTEFDIIVLIEKDSCSATWANASIKRLEDDRSKEFHAYINGEFKCVWRDGKLVE